MDYFVLPLGADPSHFPRCLQFQQKCRADVLPCRTSAQEKQRDAEELPRKPVTKGFPSVIWQNTGTVTDQSLLANNPWTFCIISAHCNIPSIPPLLPHAWFWQQYLNQCLWRDHLSLWKHLRCQASGCSATQGTNRRSREVGSSSFFSTKIFCRLPNNTWK